MDSHRVNRVQKMKRVRTPVLLNVTRVELAKSLKKAALNVRNVMPEKLVHRVKVAQQGCTEMLPWMQINVKYVALDATKVT
jgi:hypothetical protein